MRNENFAVRVRKESLVFSAAHFITFNGNVCERLHGHNYGVEVELEGPLDQNYYVVDFIAVRDTLQQIVLRLDHHVLLPTCHEQIRVTSSGNEVEARFEDRRWVFPSADCVLLPIPNTTAELLAKYIGNCLIDAMQLGSRAPIRRIRVGVDENNGQWAYWACEL